MNKITSWDGYHYGGYIYPKHGSTADAKAARDGVPVRVKVWPEGAPDPSEVPHAGEMVRTVSGEVVTVESGRPMRCADRPVGWLLTCRGANGLLGRRKLDSLTRIPDAPTVKIGEKTYDLADAVARCEPLEEVK